MDLDGRAKPFFPRATDGSLLASHEAGLVINMVDTAQETLRSVRGPAPFLPAYSVVDGAPVPPSYFGRIRGIGHAILRTGRELLLIHDGGHIRAYQGWSDPPVWGDGGLSGATCLLGDASQSPVLEAVVPDADDPTPPTKFIATPEGMIIIFPSTGSAFFFDGEVIGPLGYAKAPSAPTGKGPITDAVSNLKGYVHDGTNGHRDLGFGRKGTVEGFPGNTGNTDTAAGGHDDPESVGVLLSSSYSAELQFIDRWYNLSPISPRSAPIEISRQISNDGGSPLVWYALDKMRKHLGWYVGLGPPNTIGRILLTTRDVKHSGTAKTFEVPLNHGGALPAFATIPDNETKFYPDNTPDGALIVEPMEVAPVPRIYTAVLAFGRLLVADHSGAVWWSETGRYGTFGKYSYVYPDTKGAKVTALALVPEGVLAFTGTSVSLLSINGVGEISDSNPLSSTDGTVSPESVVTLPDGSVLWLSQQGFRLYKEGQIDSQVSAAISEWVDQINPARLSQACATLLPGVGYFCAVPEGSSRYNNIGWILSKTGWKRIEELELNCFCWVQSVDSFLLYGGIAPGRYRVGSTTESTASNHEGVWFWDREHYTYDNAARTSALETGWINGQDGPREAIPHQVLYFLRETQSSSLDVEVYKNWRHVATETQQDIVACYAEKDPPPMWSATALDGLSAWTRRRPYWKLVSLGVGPCDSYRLRISGTSRWEYIGMQMNDADAPQLPRF
jgi:hypothetical protein